MRQVAVVTRIAACALVVSSFAVCREVAFTFVAILCSTLYRLLLVSTTFTSMAGTVDDMAHVRECMAAWHTDESMTRAWLAQLQFDTSYRTSIVMPYAYGGQAGVLMTVSTGASTRKLQENDLSLAAGTLVTDPYWLYFDVWFFPRMAIFNFTGIRRETWIIDFP